MMGRSIARTAIATLITLAIFSPGCGEDSSKPKTEPSLEPPTWVATWGDSGHAPGPFGFPTGIAVSRSGKVYVANNSYGQIVVIDPNGQRIDSWGTHGSGPGQMDNPVSVAVGAEGIVAVGDVSLGRAQLFDSAGTYLAALQYPGAKRIESPVFVDIDDEGVIHATYGPSRIIATYASSGELLGRWHEDSSATQALEYPCDLVAAGPDRIYVVDLFAHTVITASADGHLIGILDHLQDAGDVFGWAYGVDVDGKGRLFVTDRVRNRIHVFDANGEYLLSWGEEGTGPGQFDEPAGIAIGPGGRIYVTELGNGRIQVFQWSEP